MSFKNTPDWLSKLQKDVIVVYWSIDQVDTLKNGKSIVLRCHESARVFQNVLSALGNEGIEVVDGRFIYANEDGMTHSWVEKVFDPVGGSVLIETTPEPANLCGYR